MLTTIGSYEWSLSTGHIIALKIVNIKLPIVTNVIFYKLTLCPKLNVSVFEPYDLLPGVFFIPQS